MNGVIGLAVVVLVLWCLLSSGSSPSRAGRSTAGRLVTVRGHAHVHPGGTKHRASRHEGGHVVGAHGVGGTVRSAQVYSDGSGLVRATVPDAKAAIVFLLAGQVAEGSKRGASADDAAVRATLREFPRAERAAVLKECKGTARRIVRQRSAEIRRVARKLDEKGSL